MENEPGPMEKLELNKIPAYFKGRRVFITGHTGFKGAWLTSILSQAGAIISGYSLAPEFKEGVYNYLDHSLIQRNNFSDLREFEKLSKEITEFKPEFIFHLAAQPLVRKSYTIPYDTFDINVMGTVNLLEAVRKLTGRCNIVIITTDKVYLNKESNIHYREEDSLGGYDPYSASKAAAEIVISSYRDSFFSGAGQKAAKALATARAGNVIGGGDWNKDRLIPDIVRSLSAKKVISIRNPESIRPWQHVLEPIHGYLKLAILMDKDPGTYSRPYNFGPVKTDHLKVREVVETAIKIWGGGEWQQVKTEESSHEAGILMLDINRAAEELSWSPKLSARNAIEWSIIWYKAGGPERKKIMENQIREYFEL